MFDHLSGAAATPLYLPNLTLWYNWHNKQGTLPERWTGKTLLQICADLNVPVWDFARPYRLDPGTVVIETEETDDSRVIRFQAPSGTLVERWELGPDGDWWQMDYAVKERSDLEVLLEIVQERHYHLDTTRLIEKQHAVGARGAVGVELPRRPFSQLFLEWLGWSRGLMLLWDAPDLVDQILAVLEEKIQALVVALAGTKGPIVVSPDNLDAQFISPPFFEQYLASSYAESAKRLHDQDKFLLVDTGGPIRNLLPALAACGIDGVQGVCGPPQSDATLAEARELAGPHLTLWGGIPQDVLVADYPYTRLETAVKQAAQEARDTGRTLLGVADRVPTTAEIDRLLAIPGLIAEVLEA